MTDAWDHLQAFAPEVRRAIREKASLYDSLLGRLRPVTSTKSAEAMPRGILALNGASGAGQGVVMVEVQDLLAARSIDLPRIVLLATRPPRIGESHKNPYIFVERVADSYRDIHHPTILYGPSEIYYEYESRPGAINAILLKDAQAATTTMMYLETVIPTLLHLKQHAVGPIPAWGNALTIVYLTAPSGAEWIGRLLGREPNRLEQKTFRTQILARIESSLADMELAAENQIPCVVSHHGKAKVAAEQILEAWGFSSIAA